MKQKGFTLTEVMTVIIVVAVLAAMAVPMYEKAIERSHISEARTVLKQMLESKLRTLEMMNKTFYVEGNNPLFGIRQLDMNIRCLSGGGNSTTCQTKDFRYTLLPAVVATLPSDVHILSENGMECKGEECADYYSLAVCAARCGGDYHNTSFLYLGGLTSYPEKMFCFGSQEACNLYGMNSNGPVGACNCDN